MYHIKKDEDSRKALDHIKDCLKAHVKMKYEKESELLIAYEAYQLGNETLDRTLELEEEISRIDNYINAIAYTCDYVKLMTQLKSVN